MRRSLPFLFALLVAPAVVPLSASAQAPGGPMSATPIATDLKKVPVGSWSEYKMNIGQMEMKSRWSLVARDAKGSTIETGIEGGPMAMMGGKMMMKMVLAPDPTTTDKPVKQLIVQMGPNDPMEMPTDSPNMPRQKFSKPDPKNLVGKEDLSVTGGKFKTSHYREKSNGATIDMWVSDEAAPLGIVKVMTTPEKGATGPNGQPVPPVTMELIARGKDAKPTMTKPAKPFDPAMFGGPRAGAAPAPAPAPAPKK